MDTEVSTKSTTEEIAASRGEQESSLTLSLTR